MKTINNSVLVSDPRYFSNKYPINPLMNSSQTIDLDQATKEHDLLINSLKKIGIKVIQFPSPKDCQDGVYVANWGLIIDNKVIPSKLPITRKQEEKYARSIFKKLNLEIIDLPDEVQYFSGQGDCLVVDDYIFCQSPYRTSKNAHKQLAKIFRNKIVVSLQTKPLRWFKIGPKKINKITGLIESHSYDLDLALAVLRPQFLNEKPIIAYCPSLFTRNSKKILNRLTNFKKIKVSKKECIKNYALNLVSNGSTVIINNDAHKFKRSLIDNGFKVIEISLHELKKGGGSIRCCSLTID